MRATTLLSAITIAAMLTACHTPRPASGSRQADRVTIAQGVVVQIGTEFGNLYTDIHPDRYDALGLEPGQWLRVDFEETAVVLVIGSSYHDVPSGTPIAVLHREGLTFAIRDGDFSEVYRIEAGAPFSISTAAPPH